MSRTAGSQRQCRAQQVEYFGRSTQRNYTQNTKLCSPCWRDTSVEGTDVPQPGICADRLLLMLDVLLPLLWTCMVQLCCPEFSSNEMPPLSVLPSRSSAALAICNLAMSKHRGQASRGMEAAPVLMLHSAALAARHARRCCRLAPQLLRRLRRLGCCWAVPCRAACS